MEEAASSALMARVRIYLDDRPEPIVDQPLPADMRLDTLDLADGPHRLIVRALGQNGREGYEEIPFNVHNGPGVVVAGLRPNSTRRGQIRLTVDAFSADDPFDPRHAEARSSIPVWVWVMALFVISWAVWYAARMWEVPPAFAQTPTYAASTQAPDSHK
jgi:hypothetical protein